jgi:hypothetical protein
MLSDVVSPSPELNECHYFRYLHLTFEKSILFHRLRTNTNLSSQSFSTAGPRGLTYASRKLYLASCLTGLLYIRRKIDKRINYQLIENTSDALSFTL